MDIHEYQAKEILASFGVTIPRGGIVYSPETAENKAREIGGLNPDYPGDQWHHGLSKLVMTCRAYGLRAIDGPFGDFNDPDAYISAAKRGAAIGIEGKWAIHPSQIELANKVFSPPEAEVNKAKRILEELEKAAKEGKGAAQLDGRMIDAASAKMAENIVNIDKLINSK